MRFIYLKVRIWLESGAAHEKLIVAIPTHGRSWKLTQDSTKTGVPPILEVSVLSFTLDLLFVCSCAALCVE